ncbi:acetate--CoA ligase [Phaeodactylibacter luteus]|uniref:Propionyl-CoA synthetase n=1 Tax=Phaeodactylibacter luteus TaxID=1564516 RepID=A0A5C6S763_9BACT|nr:acetate--CoA ligase [Phaeodactylibacter luteus]TXB70193.1 propionyl-CoA synthetase [Phaeodactylibacter luteus]
MTYQAFYDRSMADPESFWMEQAQGIDWITPPAKALYKDGNNLYRWYEGGQLNTAYLALDYHVENGRADQPAVFYDSPVTGVKRSITYRELRDEVAVFAGVLKAQGVEKGDTVIIYMPMIPQTVVAMLACARIGAIHSVVFGGFAPHELAIRINDAKPKLILAASAGKEIDRVIDYMKIVNAAVAEAEHQIEGCIVYQRDFHQADLVEGRDIDWEKAAAKAEPAACVPVDAADPLYILYTSGTTGKPKGIVRDNGGHAVAMKFSMKYVYGVEPGEVYWAASDVGWVVGHSYIVYAPLIHGCTTVVYEGKPVRTPDAGAFWRVIEEYKVKVFFTAPTAFRAIKKEDASASLKAQYDTSHLRYLFLAGERCDVATLEWCQAVLQVPVIDHWWQTESGWPMLANMAGVELLPVKPGSACKPVCGYDLKVVGPDGEPVPPNTEGAVVIRLPLAPGTLPNLWQDTTRFIESYLSPYPGYYFTGDGGYIDEEGYVFITGRIDDIINVAGHRLSTAEMEEVVAAHPAVAECAVIGIHDDLKGQIPVGFVVLKAGADTEEAQLEKELVQMVRDRVGPVASFKKATVVQRLPKTRSGKILRRIMRHIVDGKPYSPPSTIEDMSVLPELEEKVKNL